MSAVAIIYIHTFLRAVKLKFLSCLSMSDITLLSKFLFSVEPCHSLLPNANLIIVHFLQARPSMFKHLSSYCILRGRIKGFNSSITTIMCQGGSYCTFV